MLQWTQYVQPIPEDAVTRYPALVSRQRIFTPVGSEAVVQQLPVLPVPSAPVTPPSPLRLYHLVGSPARVDSMKQEVSARHHPRIASVLDPVENVIVGVG